MDWMAFRFSTGSNPNPSIGAERETIFAEVVRGDGPPGWMAKAHEEWQAKGRRDMGWNEFPIEQLVIEHVASLRLIPITHALFVRYQPPIVLAKPFDEQKTIKELNQMQAENKELSQIDGQWFASRGFFFGSQLSPEEIEKIIKSGAEPTDLPLQFPGVAEGLPMRKGATPVDPNTFDEVTYLTTNFISCWPFTPGPGWLKFVKTAVDSRREQRSGLIVP